MNCTANEPGWTATSVPETEITPVPVEIDRIRFAAPSRVKKIGAAHGFPYLKRFLNHIERGHEHADERFGRHYQQDILVGHGLRLRSPLTGEFVTAAESIAMQGKTFYRFVEADPSGAPIEYFVIASRIRWGFPLASLFVPQQNWLLTWEPAGKNGVSGLHLAALAQARSVQNSSASEDPVIVMGHKSFAHHLWNELPALETILRSNFLPSGSPILVAREPLGDIEDIFPELLGHPIWRVDPSQPLCGTRTGGLFVNLGALCIPERLRRRVVAFAQGRASAQARAIIAEIGQTGGPVFWISVRTQNPTLTNQHDVLSRIAGMLLHTYKQCAVVFDGFSLPEDFLRMPDEIRLAYARYASDTHAASEEIIASVRAISLPGPRQLLTSVAGMTMLDSIAVAQCANVYLCHAGSIQHKIGWTANVPGIIHGNRRLPVSELIARHSARLENGVAPRVTPREMFVDVAGDEAQCNYTCANPAEFTRFALGYFRRCLSPVPIAG